MHDRRDDFDFEIVNFLIVNGDVPHSPSYGVYISHLIFVLRELIQFLTAKLLKLKQGYQYHKNVKHFLNSTTDTQSWLLNTILD